MFFDKNFVGCWNTAFKMIPLALMFFTVRPVLFRVWRLEIQQETGESTKDMEASCTIQNNLGTLTWLIEAIQLF